MRGIERAIMLAAKAAELRAVARRVRGPGPGLLKLADAYSDRSAALLADVGRTATAPGSRPSATQPG